MPDLNEQVINVQVEDSSIITVPIDTTLSIAGQAADAAAVGEALAGKADADSTLSKITINGQESDAQGVIILTAEHVPMNDSTGARSVGAVLEGLTGLTAQTLKMDSSEEADTVAEAIGALQAVKGDSMPIDGTEGAASIKSVIQSLFPVGAVYASTSATAPAFFGTWTEIRITATWEQLKYGDRSHTEGVGTGTLHFWLRTA